MPENLIIPEADLLSESHYPVQIALFTEAKEFVWRLRQLSQEAGWGDDAVSVSPWANLHDWDKRGLERYAGFRLSVLDYYSVVISWADMYYYMRIAAKMHIEKHPENASELRGILASYRERFELSKMGNGDYA